ncbi:MAG: ABC transporter ATP-binding protein [Nitratireductor sp.]|nr:ABC transporter ATP-binding protein [Nitratireductor sp.]
MVKVQLNDVEKRYGPTVALAPTNLSVTEGEFLTLLGPSGSGKTTLLNIVSGMTEPTGGEVWIDGVDVTNVPSAKRGLGMVFQSYALMPHMTIFQNIAFPLQIRGLPREEIRRKVEDVLELVQLPHVAGRKPKELSGGQQQRIALARCIVYDPSIILMDEPLGALDKKLREQMQLEIKRLQVQLGITMLYVTHDQEEAMTMSDRIILMNNGSAEQIGTPNELYFQPNSSFVADFIGQSNLLDATVAGEDRVRLVNGEIITVRHDAPLSHGQSVKVLLRPEVLHLREIDAGGNRLDATIRGSVISGSTVKHFLELDGGTSVLVEELSNGTNAAPAPGDRVTISWSVGQARVLPA